MNKAERRVELALLSGAVAAALAGAGLLGSCRASGSESGVTRVVVRLPSGPSPDLPAITWDPPGHVKSVRLDETRNLSLETDGTALAVHVPELCPISVPASKSAAPIVLTARPLLNLGPDLAQVGYDTAFEINAERGCPEAQQGRLDFRQIEGPPLADWSVSPTGNELRARTVALSRFFPEPLPHGVVAVSPRTQGRYTIEATLSGIAPEAIHRTVVVTSIARATGLSNLAVSQRVMLGGAGWAVEKAPFGSHAQVQSLQGVQTFAPDVAGRWVLRDAQGSRLGVQAMTHDSTPLDCGRGECHAAIASSAFTTPMSEALLRSTDARALPSMSDGCLLDCHVVGERGLRDGGFLDVARTLGFRAPGPLAFAELPHALQRLGGVRCTSCHGPGAIPEPADRARILRASVCANCHDAPPTYTHVAEWSRSAMARSDQAPSARHDPACARCHTTGGFLDAVGARPRPDRSLDPDDAVVGISCPACHAVHGSHEGEALVRSVSSPASLGHGAASSVCSTCHAPVADEVIPSASSAVIVAGRVKLPTLLGGDELAAPTPAHANVPGGCTGCHGAAATSRPGIDHSFHVDGGLCKKCHTAGSPAEFRDGANRTLQQRAAQLVAKLRSTCPTSGSAPRPHAERKRAPPCDLDRRRARALFLVSLVVEDPAAEAHNRGFSRYLLDQAEDLLSPNYLQPPAAGAGAPASLERGTDGSR